MPDFKCRFFEADGRLADIRTISQLRRYGSREGPAVGKFFLFIVALSIAILVAMSIHIISL